MRILILRQLEFQPMPSAFWGQDERNIMGQVQLPLYSQDQCKEDIVIRWLKQLSGLHPKHRPTYLAKTKADPRPLRNLNCVGRCQAGHCLFGGRVCEWMRSRTERQKQKESQADSNRMLVIWPWDFHFHWKCSGWKPENCSTFGNWKWHLF